MPASLSVERIALKAAIAAVALAAEHLEKVREARVKTWQIGTREDVDAAERALVIAKRQAATKIYAGLVGDELPAGPSVAEAEQRLADARAAVEAAERARTELLRREEGAEKGLHFAESERAAAIGNVVRSERLGPIVAAFREATERVCRLGDLLQLLPGKSSDESYETDPRRNPRMRNDSDAVAHERNQKYAPWRIALKQLETDPTAKLPEIDFDEPAAREAA
jgi:hypothetical protein